MGRVDDQATAETVPAGAVRFVYHLAPLSELALVHLVAALLVAIRRGVREYSPLADWLLRERVRREVRGPDPGPEEISFRLERRRVGYVRLDAATIAAAFRGALDIVDERNLPVDRATVLGCCDFSEKLVGAIDLFLASTQPEWVS